MTANYQTKRFATCNDGICITAPVVFEGAKGVALLDKAPDSNSQYPEDHEGYVSVYLFDRPWGRIQERHSHGYGVNWIEYFKALLS